MLESGALKSILALALWVCISPSQAFQPDEPLPWGGRINSVAECNKEETFALAEGGGFLECLRYFGAGVEKSNRLVVVVMEGDRDNDVNRPVSEISNNTSSLRLQYANKLRARVGIPLILLSRPGTYGSTGNHRHKRTLSEFAPISAALDTLGKRYGVKRWIVVGHSGGGTAAAALLTLGRSDLECVVVTSGAFDLVERANRHRVAKGLSPKPFTDLTGTVHPYDPLHRLDGVVADENRMVFVLGNAKDKITPFEFQEKFAEGLARLGHRVRIEEVEARAPNFHDLNFGSGLEAASQCIKLNKSR